MGLGDHAILVVSGIEGMADKSIMPFDYAKEVAASLHLETTDELTQVADQWQANDGQECSVGIELASQFVADAATIG